MTHVLLGLMAGRDAHGYELKQRYDAHFPAARPLAYGQVYTALTGLERRGWAEPVDHVKAGAAERAVYAITDAGAVELDRWLGEIEPPAPHAGSALQVKVTVALLVAGRAAAEGFLTSQRAAHLARMREYARIVADPSSGVAEVLGADYALTHLDADLRWIENARNRVDDLASEITSVPTESEG